MLATSNVTSITVPKCGPSACASERHPRGPPPHITQGAGSTPRLNSVFMDSVSGRDSVIVWLLWLWRGFPWWQKLGGRRCDLLNYLSSLSRRSFALVNVSSSFCDVFLLGSSWLRIVLISVPPLPQHTRSLICSVVLCEWMMEKEDPQKRRIFSSASPYNYPLRLLSAFPPPYISFSLSLIPPFSISSPQYLQILLPSPSSPIAVRPSWRNQLTSKPSQLSASDLGWKSILKFPLTPSVPLRPTASVVSFACYCRRSDSVS